MAKGFFLFLCAFLSIICAHAQFSFSDSLQGKLEASDLQIFIDDEGSLQLGDVLKKPFEATTDDLAAAASKLNIKRNIWVKFILIAKADLNEPFSIYVYSFSQARRYLIYESKVDSTDVGFFSLSTMGSDPIFAENATIKVKKGDSIVVAIRIKEFTRSRHGDQLLISLATFSEIEAIEVAESISADLETYLYAAFCGLLLFQLLYMLLQWYLVQKIEYFYYFLYVLLVLAYFYNRFSAFYVSSPALAFVDIKTTFLLNDFLLLAPTFFYLRFARYFTDLKYYDPKLALHFKIFEIYMASLAIIAIFLNNLPNDFNKSLPLIAMMVVHLPFSIYALIRIAMQRRTVATFLVTGSACVTIAHFLGIAYPYLFQEPSGFAISTVITLTGITLEIIIFNSGLLFKAKEAEVANIKVQQEYIEVLKNREKLQDEFISVRDNIARDLHDDIGSSLSSISLFSYTAHQKLLDGDSSQTAILLSNIENSAVATLDAMSDLVWATYPENDSNTKLIERISSFAYEMLSAVNCRFLTSIDDSFFLLPLNQMQRKNILLILKEAVNNAAKYSESNEALLQIQPSDGGSALISLSDNGKGIDVNRPRGNGTRTMKSRAMELSDYFEIRTSESGTQILFKIN